MMLLERETDADLFNEGEVVLACCERWRCACVKTLPRSPIDYRLVRGSELVAWAEIKCRTNASTLYTEYMVDAEKVWKGIGLAVIDEVPFPIA
jgi:hypothetical protein